MFEEILMVNEFLGFAPMWACEILTLKHWLLYLGLQLVWRLHINNLQVKLDSIFTALLMLQAAENCHCLISYEWNQILTLEIIFNIYFNVEGYIIHLEST